MLGLVPRPSRELRKSKERPAIYHTLQWYSTNCLPFRFLCLASCRKGLGLRWCRDGRILDRKGSIAGILNLEVKVSVPRFKKIWPERGRSGAMISMLCCFPRKDGGADIAAENSKVGKGAKVHTAHSVEGDHCKHESKTPATQGAVLVELFTSQGCATSPAADLLISKLGGGDAAEELGLDVPIVVLAYHVEFWDYLGWKDPFASSLWTVRQRAYGQALQQDSIYTPQVVVQGRSQCLGSTADSVLSLIRSAPRFPVPDLKATFSRPSAESLQVSVSGSLRFKVEGYNLDIMMALYENGLVTDCTKGENRGRVLTNDFVVKGLEKACSVRDISARKTVSGKVTFNLWEGFSSNKCGLVIFFQNSSSLEVLGAQNLALPPGV